MNFTARPHLIKGSLWNLIVIWETEVSYHGNWEGDRNWIPNIFSEFLKNSQKLDSKIFPEFPIPNKPGKLPGFCWSRSIYVILFRAWFMTSSILPTSWQMPNVFDFLLYQTDSWCFYPPHGRSCYLPETDSWCFELVLVKKNPFYWVWNSSLRENRSHAYLIWLQYFCKTLSFSVKLWIFV